MEKQYMEKEFLKNRIVRQFIKSFEYMKQRGWEKIYVAVDIHDTIHHPTYSKEMSTVYYDYAHFVLSFLSMHKEVCLIQWSCCLKETNILYQKAFANDGINFEYVNENPEVPSTDYADFDTKMYLNVGIDDKFGFIPEEDWKDLKDYILWEFKNNPEKFHLVATTE